MNKQDTYCDKIHALILLEESGELTSGQAAELEKHLADCPACVSYRNDAAALINAGRTALPDIEPSRQAVAGVLANAQGATNVVHFVSPLRYAAAAAAILALVLGAYFTIYRPGNNGGDSQSYEAGDVQILAAIASDGSVEADDTGTAGQEELKELAETLLRLQGFKMDEGEADITEIFLPTDLQSRNTPASPAGTSV